MSAPILPNTFIGEYRVIDFVGAGGMGEVYRAIHSREGRVVAVKLLTRTGGNAKTVDRFLNEASIQAKLDHPNVTRFLELTRFNGQPCIIMEYIDGETLADRIKSLGALPISEVVYIFHAVTEAIAYIHSHNIIHRDIKSNNIKISSTAQVKLLDFGIAKAESTPKMTATGDTIGTLEYLAPEQLKGGTSDARSDIWALGVLLYEMITGRVPFEANTIGDLCDKIMKADYVRPAVLNPSISPAVEAIIARCLKKRPADRYQSAQELLRETARVAAGVSTPRLSLLGKRGQGLDWAKRNSARLLAAGAALIVIIAAWVVIANLWPGPDDNDSARGRIVKNNNRTAQSNSNRPVETEVTQAGLASQDPSLRKIRVTLIGGQGDVYSPDGTWKSKTPYVFSERIGKEVSLVLKREGCVDKGVSFRVSEDNMYDFTMEKVEKSGR